jgi:hypothetical protein
VSAAKKRGTAIKGAPPAPPARPWTDDEVSGVLTAEIVLSVARHGVPGFDSVRGLIRNYEQTRAHPRPEAHGTPA